MRTIVVGLLALAALPVVSCKKKRTMQELHLPVSTPRPTQDYLHIKPGNYWVYQLYFVKPTGDAEAFEKYDTTRVEKDTVIGDKTYHKLMHYYEGGKRAELITDSLDYVINHSGHIIFSPSDFGRIFRSSYSSAGSNTDSMVLFTTYMGDRDMVITVPAGTFQTSAFIVSIKYLKDPVLRGKAHIYYNRYSSKVGLVSYTEGADPNGESYEYRLVTYNLK